MLWTILIAAGSVSAQTIEVLRANAERMPPPEPPRIALESDMEDVEDLHDMIRTPRSHATIRSTRPPSWVIPLDKIRNGLWRTEASFLVNGAPAFAGFAATRKKDGFLSLLGQGRKLPLLLNIRDMLGSPRSVVVNGARVRVSFKPKIVDRLASKVRIKGGGTTRSFKMRQLLGAVYDQGVPIHIEKTDYRVLFYDSILKKDGFGRFAPSRQNITIIRRKGKKFRMVVVPFEDVPSDRVAAFTLHNGDRLGIQRRDEGRSLGLFPNP